MIRIVRTRTLRKLRTDLAKAQAETAQAEQAAEVYSAEAEQHHTRYLAQKERSGALAEQLNILAAQLAADVADLRAAANDPASGSEVRGRIALGVLRRLIEENRALGRSSGGLDLVAGVLGLIPLTTNPDDARHGAAESAGHVAARALEETDQ